MPFTTVIGAGSWGTALALVLARNGHSTILWGRDKISINAMREQRCNQSYLPNITFPSSLAVTSDLDEALAVADLVLIAVPSHAFKSILPTLNSVSSSLTGVIWASKGLDPSSGKFLHEIFLEQFGEQLPFAILSGPSFAEEVAENLPTAVTLASPSKQLIEIAHKRFHCKTFRVYPTDDCFGVQIAGAVKNILAIAAGINDGMKLGANARAALITRGLAEMWRLGQAFSCQMETFMGLAGLGDLVLTCSDDKSRNRRFGLAIGKGLDVAAAKLQVGNTIEGMTAAKEIRKLAESKQIDMPISEHVYRVLYEGLPPKVAVEQLLSR